MSANPGPPDKPPRDYFPLIYWLPFLVIVTTLALWIVNKPMQVRVPFLKHEVPAYHVIMSNDVYIGSADQSIVSTKKVREMQGLIGHYTLALILPDHPISENQIGPKPDLTLISNTLAVAIPANSAMLLGGNLNAGDVVSLAAIPFSGTNSPPAMIFNKVLVLDVKLTGNQPIIILAIPINRWSEYLAQIRNATILF